MGSWSWITCKSQLGQRSNSNSSKYPFNFMLNIWNLFIYPRNERCNTSHLCDGIQKSMHFILWSCRTRTLRRETRPKTESGFTGWLLTYQATRLSKETKNGIVNLSFNLLWVKRYECFFKLIYSGYVGAMPPANTGLHRYVFSVFKQKLGKTDLPDVHEIKATELKHREKFHTK